MGAEILALLETGVLGVGSLSLLASPESAGQTVNFLDETLDVEPVSEGALAGLDLAFMAADQATAIKYAPAAADGGCVVIDLSGAFAQDPETPLILPELNAHLLADRPAIIACPMGLTVMLALVLGPLIAHAGLRRAVVTSLEPVSGQGRAGVGELAEQSRGLLMGQETAREVYPHRVAFNSLPLIGRVDEDGAAESETRLALELARLLGRQAPLAATRTTAPLFFGLSASLALETELTLSPEAARRILAQAEGVAVIDEPGFAKFPLASETAGEDRVLAGRIRRDPSLAGGILMWLAADNIRRGAAIGAVDIARRLAEGSI